MWLTEYLHHAFPVPAKVSKGPDNVKAKRGTTVVLKVEISGEPPPDVAWLKDGDDTNVKKNLRFIMKTKHINHLYI